MLTGVVSEFAEARGLGTITASDGENYLFHLIEIADGTRMIEVGQRVSFLPLPKFGRQQARSIHKV